tara:strand:+ start:144 stop:761 length:618 start_codon:yes stop_codon:yes gene_type:complete
MIINGGFLTMGTKRVGLARMQALMENLKRTLTLGTAEISAASLTATTDLIGNGNFKVDTSGHKTGVEGITHSASITATSGTTWSSGALAIPAHAIITDMGVVVTATLGYGSGVCGLKAGITAGTAGLAAAVANSLTGTATTAAVGLGCSTNAAQTAAMTGNAVIVNVIGTAYAAAARDVHLTLTAAQTITGGTVRFWVKYMHIEG